MAGGASKRDVRTLLERHGVAPNKTYGQNFLLDGNTLAFIAEQGELSARDIVLEVGTGIGNLTTVLAAAPCHVISVEIDRGLHAIAARQLAARENITLLHADVLDGKQAINPVVLEAIRQHVRQDKTLKVIANLPYSITTPWLISWLGAGLAWERMILLIQEESALRMTAAPGVDEYGILAVLCALTTDSKRLRGVPADMFYPAPQVQSAIVLLRPQLAAGLQAADIRPLAEWVRLILNYRRKTLGNALKQAGLRDNVATALTGSGFDLSRRGESFSAAEVLRMYMEVRGAQALPQ